jgi:hypothetical protein
MATRRRWLQFSLRTAFILMTALAAWLGIIVHRAREQREAVKAIEALMGRVQYDWQPKMVEVTVTLNGVRNVKGWRRENASNTAPDAPDWLRQLVGDEYFQEVEEIEFPYSSLPLQCEVAELIPLLKRLRALKVIKLRAASAGVQWALKEALPGCKVYDVQPRIY